MPAHPQVEWLRFRLLPIQAHGPRGWCEVRCPCIAIVPALFDDAFASHALGDMV